jgi:penicillin-binding protein 1C
MPVFPDRRRLARAAALTVLAVALFTITWRTYRARAGEPSARLDDRWHEGRRVLDRRGRLLREIPSAAGHRGRSLPLEEVGERLVLATLAAEDRGFFEHEGVDATAVLRALGQNVRHARIVSGASTITQQLVKLLDNEGVPGPRTLGVKIEEAARAQNLERVTSKRDILEAYLDRLPYGHGLTGPEAAARGYFGVAARDLSWAQATFLAVLPRAPSYLDPYDHIERARLRQRALLDELREHALIVEADHARAIAEPVAPRAIVRAFHAPHFVEALLAEGILAETGASRGGAEAVSGATTTTLDLDLQRDAEGLVRTHLAALAELGASSAAAIVVDNARGEVLAYIGSADFHDARIAGQVDLARARRQPGSTLKPFVYALAFAAGRTGAEMLPDVPAAFAEAGGAYAPGNFDGTFEGPISAREALAGSLNVPAVRLAAELPPGALLAALRALGLESLDRDAAHYGLALALGSGEVTLRELAGAYATLARGGRRIPLRVLLPRPDEPAPSGEPIIDAGVAAQVLEALSDPLARVRGLHGQGPFDFGFPVAVKTGTSSGYRDTWCVGSTRERTVAVWVGNADGSPTRELTGASGAGPLFADLMKRAMAGVTARAPLWDPELLDEVEVCPLSGKLPGPACPERAARRFRHGHPPGEACDLHVRASPALEAPRTTSGPAPPAPFRCDPAGSRTIAVLPEVFDAWLARKEPGAPGRDPLGVPWYSRGAVAGCDAGQGRPAALRIDHPASGSVLVRSRRSDASAQAVEIGASFSGDTAMARRVAAVEFVVDGAVAARAAYPFRASIPAEAGDHEVLVRPVDPALPVRAGVSRFSVR